MNYWDRAALRHYIAIALEEDAGMGTVAALSRADIILKAWEDEIRTSLVGSDTPARADNVHPSRRMEEVTSE